MSDSENIENSGGNKSSSFVNPFNQPPGWKERLSELAFPVAGFVALLGSLTASIFALDWIPLWLIYVLCFLPLVMLVLVGVMLESKIFSLKQIHPRFGRLYYEKPVNKPGGKGTWNGIVPFLPDGEPEVAIGLPGDRNGPVDGCDEFYSTLVERYPQLLPQIAEACWPQYSTWCGKYSDAAENAQQLQSLLTLGGFWLSDVEKADVYLDYTVPQDTGGHSLLVHLSEWRIQSAHWEG